MTARAARTIQIEGQSVRVFEAWRAPSGLGLAYFAAEGDPGLDRRSALDPAVSFTDLTDDEVQALWTEAASLTPTERRLTDPTGRLWLAQGVGPVWARGGTAADAVGVRFVCLSAQQPPIHVGGVALDLSSEAELLAVLTRHLDAREP